MLAVHFLSLLTTASAVKNVTECPAGCGCDLASSGSKLIINCLPDVDQEQLSRQLDSMLSAHHYVEFLTSLSITNTLLTRVPASVCKLRNLHSLNLDHNKITELPHNCFGKLTKLVTLSATNNAITGLHDGLFDGLQSLVNLVLRQNLISFIGLRVFSNSSDMTSLRLLDMADNRLTSLEPWWYYRCIVGSAKSIIRIIVSNNLISNFTNKLRFNFRCGMKPPHGRVSIRFNQITHIADILHGWNVAGTGNLLCLLNIQQAHPLMKFYIDGLRYACDCTDFFIYKLAKMAPMVSILDGVHCIGGNNYTDIGQSMLASTVPLNDFVCELSSRCPFRCQCVYRPGNATLHVYCSATNLSTLPLELPPLPKSYIKYKLDFSSNKLLRRLEHRPYFVNTSILDVSNCSLLEINIGVLKNVSRFSFVNLRGNMLQSFPRESDTVNISAKFLIGNNPWRCSCENSWMIGWLQNMSDQILDTGDVTCEEPSRMYGRNILKVTEEDFCVDPVKRILTITLSAVASFVGIILVLVITGILIYKRRIIFYRRWKFHPFDRDECVGEDMDYDVFLCCSSEDHNPHGLRILREMESNGYRVCYHERDFLPGQLITDNMAHGIEGSKRTVCLISDNFLGSPFCMMEFDMAYHHNVVVKHKKRLIVLMMLDSPTDLYVNDASDTATLRQYLRQYTYIDYTADDWLDKLLYALPLRGLLQHNQDRNDDDVQLLQNVQ